MDKRPEHQYLCSWVSSLILEEGLDSPRLTLMNGPLKEIMGEVFGGGWRGGFECQINEGCTISVSSYLELMKSC